MLKRFRVLAFVLVMVGLFAGTANAYDNIYKDVTLVDNGKQSRFRTTSDTISELLDEQNVTLKHKDKINKKLEENVYSGIEVVIDRGIYVTAMIDGTGRSVKVEQGAKVGNLVSEMSRKQDIKYVYEDGLYSDDLNHGDKVNLKVIKKSEVKEAEPVAFEVVEEDNPELEEGLTTVFADGAEGVREKTYEVTYLSGKEVDKKLINDVVTKEPANKVVHVGTKPKPKNVIATNAGDFKYSNVITMEATAYTNGKSETGKEPGDKYYGITASGMVAKYGVVAVDPRVIPLGTKLYIDGYGYSIAGDTGSAIKGNKIDLFFNTYQECVNFGRRPITVYVLED